MCPVTLKPFRTFRNQNRYENQATDIYQTTIRCNFYQITAQRLNTILSATSQTNKLHFMEENMPKQAAMLDAEISSRLKEL